MAATYHISSGAGGAGGSAAIAIVELTGDVEAILGSLRVAPVGAGRVGLREAPGVDTMVIARVSARHALLFPHAGPAVIRRLADALEHAGATPRTSRGESANPWPEAPDAFTSVLNGALAHAASPLAIDLLLEQPRRWNVGGEAPSTIGRLSPDECRVLNRLLDPPLVVAVGPPNVGKSSLLNALAGRTVSVVADEPGTTRDHVGVLIDLAGLVIRFIDAPGFDEGAIAEVPERSIQEESQRLAMAVASGADLLLRCGDRMSGFRDDLLPDATSMVVALRSDLGLPDRNLDAVVSLLPGDGADPARGSGLDHLVRTLRDRLVPPALLADQRAWKFW